MYCDDPLAAAVYVAGKSHCLTVVFVRPDIFPDDFVSKTEKNSKQKTTGFKTIVKVTAPTR